MVARGRTSVFPRLDGEGPTFDRSRTRRVPHRAANVARTRHAPPLVRRIVIVRDAGVPEVITDPDETTLVHELAHQWFGDAVTLRKWPDTWLHEGFAEWSEWTWSERHGGPTAQDFFDDFVAENDRGTWDPAPGLLDDAADLFSNSVYDRGAMTLHALCVEVGDATFFRILRDWFAEHKYANATTADFIALAQRDSRRTCAASSRSGCSPLIRW